MCEQLQPEELEQQRQDIVDFGLVRIGGKHAVQCLSIIGQIEGHTIKPPSTSIFCPSWWPWKRTMEWKGC